MMTDDALIRLLAGVIKKAKEDYINLPSTHTNFHTAKQFLENGCYGTIDPEVYMEYLEEAREEHWRSRLS